MKKECLTDEQVEKMTNKTETYRTRTIVVGNCTINIHQPILTNKERLKREEMVKTALANFGRALEGIKC